MWPAALRVALQGVARALQKFWAGRLDGETHPAPAGGGNAEQLEAESGRVDSAAPAGAKPGTLEAQRPGAAALGVAV